MAIISCRWSNFLRRWFPPILPPLTPYLPFHSLLTTCSLSIPPRLQWPSTPHIKKKSLRFENCYGHAWKQSTPLLFWMQIAYEQYRPQRSISKSKYFAQESRIVCENTNAKYELRYEWVIVGRQCDVYRTPYKYQRQRVCFHIHVHVTAKIDMKTPWEADFKVLPNCIIPICSVGPLHESDKESYKSFFFSTEKLPTVHWTINFL